jgi:methionyl-tRNA formyltransferase
MKIVFFGTPDFAVPTLKKLLDRSEFNVIGVVTQPDKKRGRGNQLVPAPIKVMAIDRQIPVWQPAKIKKDPDTIAALKGLNADVFVVVAYGQILSPEILDLPRLGCINVHGSLLPAYRGAAPIQRCLTEGVKETGITTMLMDAGMDTGDMLLKASLSIGLLDRVDTITARLADLGGDLLLETLDRFSEITPIPQDASLATYAPPIQKSEYAIDWHQPALTLHNQIRGFYPHCATSYKSQSLKLMATVPLGTADTKDLPPEWAAIETVNLSLAAPGTIVQIAKGIGPILATGEGFLLLREAQPAGKRPQSGADLINGLRLTIGDVFV